jgi:rubrerythrin
MTEQAKRTIRVRNYTRTVPIKAVTFSCTVCGRRGVNEQYPGQTPKYCPSCGESAKRTFAKLRQQRRRAALRGLKRG